MVFGNQITAAQTCDVTWRKIDHPRDISRTVEIQAGQIFCIEPGVNVQFINTARINVLGELSGHRKQIDLEIQEGVFGNE